MNKDWSGSRSGKFQSEEENHIIALTANLRVKKTEPRPPKATFIEIDR